jgi:hypothetical protein
LASKRLQKAVYYNPYFAVKPPRPSEADNFFNNCIARRVTLSPFRIQRSLLRSLKVLVSGRNL